MHEFKGRIAFWPVVAHPEREQGAYGLGVVEENDPGYRPYEGPPSTPRRTPGPRPTK